MEKGHESEGFAVCAYCLSIVDKEDAEEVRRQEKIAQILERRHIH